MNIDKPTLLGIKLGTSLEGIKEAQISRAEAEKMTTILNAEGAAESTKKDLRQKKLFCFSSVTLSVFAFFPFFSP